MISKYGLAIPMKEKYMERIARLLEAGDYTRSQIVEIVTDEGLTAAENAYWYLNRLWDNGCIVENIFQLND